ncbi:hypothetical protein D3OALGA1CA_3551 [Olavius algarvensis associated proteobacterium Delta 3]|nr:hypothetical protein D3OALGA1CA_3551 [Olavius algarvensis associated proteobacterium Delta 3]
MGIRYLVLPKYYNSKPADSKTPPLRAPNLALTRQIKSIFFQSGESRVS